MEQLNVEDLTSDLSSRLLELREMSRRQPEVYSSPSEVYLYDSSNNWEDERRQVLLQLADKMSRINSSHWKDLRFIIGLPTPKEFKRLIGKGIYLYDLNPTFNSGSLIKLLVA
ncbi:MAG: hypothetical protein AABX66_02810 [Nanoarchaeota archaeon]